MSASFAETAWRRGRLDARSGPSELLFGRMHEDCAIELGVFPQGGRVFSIASAGCTAMELSRCHEVVAADINPAQVEYVRQRLAGGPAARGAAERRMALMRAFAPLAGWRRARLLRFLDLENPAEQTDFWRRHLDTRRCRLAMDVLFARPVLDAAYARPFLAAVPPRFGRVLRGRIERGISLHPNRTNPHARALFLGEWPGEGPPEAARRIRLVQADAASFLETEPPESYDGFTLSNILDGANGAYRRRLLAAVRRAAAPNAVAVLRSFAEPPQPSRANLAAQDRSMLWGMVEAAPAEAL